VTEESRPEHYCGRCGHHSDWHRLDDTQNLGPLDHGAKFRCLGGSNLKGCSHGCPDWVAPLAPAVTAPPEGRPVGSCPNCGATVEKCAESVGPCCFACFHWAYRPRKRTA
jgi:hypothetical protein